MLDSVVAARTNAAALKNTISTHETTIESLNSKLKETTDNLTTVTNEKDSMSLLGPRSQKELIMLSCGP